MKAIVALVLVVAAAATTRDNYFRLPEPYSYSCQENTYCARKERGSSSEYVSLETCQLTCGKSGAIWPQPTGQVEISHQTVSFSPNNLRVTQSLRSTSDRRVVKMLEQAIDHFERNLHFLHPDYPKSQKEHVREFRDYHQREQYEKQYGQQQSAQINNPDVQEFQQQQRHENPEKLVKQEQQSFRDREQRQQYLRYSPFQRQRSNPGVERQDVNLEITVNKPDNRLKLETEENYVLAVETQNDVTTIIINAPTYFGARHALETLSQLIAYDDINNALQIVRDAQIQDEPRFKYRGFMLDTARNYYPKEDLMRLMDSMAYNKMNYFHWHITDAAAFPMYSFRRPEMAYYGAYCSRSVYYPEDIAEVVEYANLRGISVVPEMSAPGRSSAGWQWGNKEGKGELVLCNQQPETWFNYGKEPPSGQMNIVNPELYPILGELYRDFMDNFDPELFHMGGDDVSFRCFEQSPEIQKYMADNGKTANSNEYFKLWDSFQTQAYNKLQEAAQDRKVTPMIYSSSFASKYINKGADKNYIIHLQEETTKPVIAEYINNGNRVIFSNVDQWNLDCVTEEWIGDKAASCPDKTPNWETMYRNSPLDILIDLGVSNARSSQDTTLELQGVPVASTQDLVLGGEATLQSFETDANGLQSKVWPRVSAVAERLWSDPTTNSDINKGLTLRRLNLQRERMVTRGVKADPLQPEYCLHNEGACVNREQYTARTALPEPFRQQPQQQAQQPQQPAAAK